MRRRRIPTGPYLDPGMLQTIRREVHQLPAAAGGGLGGGGGGGGFGMDLLGGGGGPGFGGGAPPGGMMQQYPFPMVPAPPSESARPRLLPAGSHLR